MTLSVTALLAAVAGGVQATWLREPLDHPGVYVALWLMTAVVCAALIATQMMTRASRLHSGMADEMIRMAVTQFLPAGVAGALLPFALLRCSREVFWMLPGLWQIVFSLGVFASCRSLPRPMLLIGGWFLLTGFACLVLGDGRALVPETMALPYSLGMAMVAMIQYRSAKGWSAADGEEE